VEEYSGRDDVHSRLLVDVVKTSRKERKGSKGRQAEETPKAVFFFADLASLASFA
jgi:hypothetical protein